MQLFESKWVSSTFENVLKCDCNGRDWCEEKRGGNTQQRCIASAKKSGSKIMFSFRLKSGVSYHSESESIIHA